MTDKPDSMTPEREKEREWRSNYEVILDAILVEIEMREKAKAEIERLKARVDELERFVDECPNGCCGKCSSCKESSE